MGFLRETIRAYQKNDPAARSALEIFFLYNGLHATIYYRISHWLYCHHCRFLASAFGHHPLLHPVRLHRQSDCQPAVRCGGPPNQGGEFMSLHCNRRTQLLLLTGLILLVLLVAFLAGRLIPDSAVAADFAQAKEPPSWSHPFGTDHLGRDLFLRTLKGLSTSLTVGICASAISAVAAVLIGIAAATGSRAMDSFINWLIDLVMGVPHTVLVILISFACGRGLKGLLIGVAATHWTGLARLIRGEGRTPWGLCSPGATIRRFVWRRSAFLASRPAGLCPGIKAPWDGCCISMEAATFAGIWSMPRALAQCCLL